MGIQKAVVAFTVSLVGVLSAVFSVDISVTEGQITALVALVLGLLNTFGVWKVTNTPASS